MGVTPNAHGSPLPIGEIHTLPQVCFPSEDGEIADEARAIGRILQLLYYLESIQEK